MDIHASAEILDFFKQFENPLVDVAYAKSLEVSPIYIQSQNDTLKVRAMLSNSENHSVNAYAVIQGKQSRFIDTLRLFDDGLHGDGDSSDNIWSNIKLASGLPEDAFKVHLITYDSTFNKTLDFHWPAQFIKYGPVAFENYSFSSPDKGF